MTLPQFYAELRKIAKTTGFQQPSKALRRFGFLSMRIRSHHGECPIIAVHNSNKRRKRLNNGEWPLAAKHLGIGIRKACDITLAADGVFGYRPAIRIRKRLEQICCPEQSK